MSVKDPNLEFIVENASRPGIEVIMFRGGLGYGDEQLSVSNSVGNGLRIEVLNEDTDWNCFHIHDPATARLLAEKLIEWSYRICDPPNVEPDGR